MGMIDGAAKAVGIDTSKIEGVFGGFVDNFSSVFDNILLPFNGIMQGLQNIADKFGNFVMSHEVKPITVLIPNLDTLDGKIASAVEKAIKDALPKTNNNKDFKSNGN
jgi:phage-related protein